MRFLVRTFPLFSLLFLFSCAAENPQETPSEFSLDGVCSSNSDDDCIQIASFNVENLLTTSDPAKKNGIVQIVTDNGFDLIAFQEMQNDAASDMASQLGSNFAYITGDSGNDQNLAIFYNKNLLSLLLGEELSGSPFDNATWGGLRDPLYAHFRIKATGDTFKLLNLHLKALTESTYCYRRQAQVLDVTEYLQGQSGDFVLLGDFNDQIAGNGNCSTHNIDTLYALENREGYAFATTVANGMGASSRYTYPSESSVIDHIFLSNALYSRAQHIAGTSQIVEIVNHNTPSISDHNPIYIWLKVSE